MLVWLFFAVWPDWLDALLIAKKAFVSSILNGVTLAGLYFLVASGFTLVFGLMRNVNLAHGSLYLLGAYIGYEVGDAHRLLAARRRRRLRSPLAAGRRCCMQVLVFRRMEGDELRQTLVTIGISIVAADLMLAVWAGKTYQFDDAGLARRRRHAADRHRGQVERHAVIIDLSVLPPGRARRRHRHRHRAVAGAQPHPHRHDDPRRRRRPRHAVGLRRQRACASSPIVFAIGAGLAGFAGVVGGSALSIAPGEDVRYLLASLVVVIVGGMGSITGAAIGALLIGLAEQIGLAYFPTYGIVLTFVIMVAVLAFRPQGIMGTRRHERHRPAAPRPPSRAGASSRRELDAAPDRAGRARCSLYPARRDAVLHLPDRRAIR